MHCLLAPARWTVRFVLVSMLGVGPVWAQAEGDELVQGLIRLRGEVEQLNSELELLREEQRSTLMALNAQKAELSAAAERQQLAAREARQKLEAQQTAVTTLAVSADALLPVLIAAVTALEAQIRVALPFKVEERLGELQSFRSQLESGALLPQRGVNRLWAFYEDEFRLTRENGLHAQTILLNNERVLADVVKIGSMALYFRTQDGRVGQARRAGQDWSFVTFEDEPSQLRVRTLFDALGKQIRQGYFELPLAAAGGAQ